jgi:hypothetical protein
MSFRPFAVLWLLWASACDCESLAVSDDTGVADGGSLLSDADPRDAALSCGRSLHLSVLDTMSAVGPSAVGAAAAGGDILVIWREPRVINYHVAILPEGGDRLAEVALPWGGDRALSLIRRAESPILLSLGSDEPQISWSEWEAGRLSEPRSFDFGLAADEFLGDFIACSGRAAAALLITRDDGTSGVSIVDWSGSVEEPTVSESWYPPDGAFGSGSPVDPERLPPAVAACIADSGGGVEIAVFPGTPAGVPVLARFDSFASTALLGPIGTESSRALTATATDGSISYFVLTEDEIVAHESSSGAVREVGRGPLDLTAFPNAAVGSFASDDGSGTMIVYSNDAGTWVTTWRERDFGERVRMTDLRCYTRDPFLVADGVASLFTSCGLGLGGQQLVVLRLCGEAGP